MQSVIPPTQTKPHRFLSGQWKSWVISVPDYNFLSPAILKISCKNFFYKREKYFSFTLLVLRSSWTLLFLTFQRDSLCLSEQPTTYGNTVPHWPGTATRKVLAATPFCGVQHTLLSHPRCGTARSEKTVHAFPWIQGLQLCLILTQVMKRGSCTLPP